MKINVLLFGIATDLAGSSSLKMELLVNSTIAGFKEVVSQHPQLKQMSTYAVAINENYATDETIIKECDVLAIIPPVSGG